MTRHRHPFARWPWLLLAAVLSAPTLQAETLKVAVASNFFHTAKLLAEEFQRSSGHSVKLSPGSTGKHYAQIRHGAPFDVFLAADTARPQKLEQQGRIVAGSRFTYAMGRLVLWSPRPGVLDQPEQALTALGDDRLAIANPRLAPYGKAAEQVLTALGVWPTIRNNLVRGENVGQTYHFVRNGGATLGFVALSQLHQPGSPAGGSRWLPPDTMYDPIEQQVVLLRPVEAAQAFLDFLRSPAGHAIIRANGYKTPNIP